MSERSLEDIVSTASARGSEMALQKAMDVFKEEARKVARETCREQDCHGSVRFGFDSVGSGSVRFRFVPVPVQFRFRFAFFNRKIDFGLKKINFFIKFRFFDIEKSILDG